MAEARLAVERRGDTSRADSREECHAEDVHRQFVDEVVPAVMKVVGAIVGDRQQRGADGENDEAAEEQQMEKRAERLLVHAFLRQRVNSMSRRNPDPPVTLKSARLDLFAIAGRGPGPATRARRCSPRS